MSIICFKQSLDKLPRKKKIRSFVIIDKGASSFCLTGHVMYDLCFCFHVCHQVLFYDNDNM